MCCTKALPVITGGCTANCNQTRHIVTFQFHVCKGILQYR
jgi:hypothetical protein